MVESVSRKFARRIDKAYSTLVGTGGTGSNKEIPGIAYMGAQTKQVTYIGYGTFQKNIMFFRRPSGFFKTDKSEAGILRRTYFSVASKWAAARAKNLSTIAADMALYKQCQEDFTKKVKGVGAKGYGPSGIRGWLFAIAMAYQVDGETPPSGALSLDA